MGTNQNLRLKYIPLFVIRFRKILPAHRLIQGSDSSVDTCIDRR